MPHTGNRKVYLVTVLFHLTGNHNFGLCIFFYVLAMTRSSIGCSLGLLIGPQTLF